jgi:hypothetical protein
MPLRQKGKEGDFHVGLDVWPPRIHYKDTGAGKRKRGKISNLAPAREIMSTNVDTHVKKTVNSVLVTLDRCGRHEFAATLLRKGVFIALVRTPEIEEYCRLMKEKGDWHSMQHAHYGIMIDTQIPVPAHYDVLESHARDLAQKFADIEEWHQA